MKTYEPRLPDKYKKTKYKLTKKDKEFCKAMRSPVRIMTLKQLANKFKVSARTILVHTDSEYRARWLKAYLKWLKKNKKKPNIVKTRRENERRRMRIKNKLFPEQMKKSRKIRREYMKNKYANRPL